MNGKTILDWLIEDLVKTKKIEEYVVISNHKFAHHFENWAAEKRAAYGKITVVDDDTDSNETRLSAVRDIQFAVEKLGISEDVLVIAGDNLLDFSFAGFLTFAEEKGTSCVMCHEENDLAKQQYLDFAMFCLGLQSTNIKAVVVPEWKEDVAKAIAGDKASAQEKFWDRSDSIAWNVDSLHSKYLAVLQVLQV